MAKKKINKKKVSAFPLTEYVLYIVVSMLAGLGFVFIMQFNRSFLPIDLVFNGMVTSIVMTMLVFMDLEVRKKKEGELI